MSLVKTRTVLSHIQTKNGRSWFGTVKDDESDRVTFIDLDEEVWFEMLQPTVITITVEPGDRLNEGDA